jgi:hypothetical protein
MKTHLNLLPWPCLRNRMIRLRAVQWAAVCVAACLLTVTVFGFRMMRYRTAVAALGRL